MHVSVSCDVIVNYVTLGRISLAQGFGPVTRFARQIWTGIFGKVAEPRGVMCRKPDPENSAPSAAHVGEPNTNPFCYHDGSVAEDDALAETVVSGGREPIRRDLDVVAVGRVELEGRKIIIWRRCAVPHKGNHSVVIGIVDAVTATRLAHFGLILWFQVQKLSIFVFLISPT